MPWKINWEPEEDLKVFVEGSMRARREVAGGSRAMRRRRRGRMVGVMKKVRRVGEESSVEALMNCRNWSPFIH